MKKKAPNSEKIIFAAVLIAVGIFVISLFSFTLVRSNMTDGLGSTIHTQLVEDGSSESKPATMDNSAQMLIVIGSTVFCLLGGVIFLGLKAHDKYL